MQPPLAVVRDVHIPPSCAGGLLQKLWSRAGVAYRAKVGKELAGHGEGAPGPLSLKHIATPAHRRPYVPQACCMRM